MAGGKQTPRQRMMGILYLVLLGLVALSVPDSLMDAFKNIRISLDRSTVNVDKGIQTTYSNFKATKLKDQKERAEPILKRAEDASAIAKRLDDYIDSLKSRLIKAGGGINPTTGDVDARENLDVSPHIMITDKKGEELRQKINETHDQLLGKLKDEKERKGVNFSLNADAPKSTNGPQKSWEDAYFGEGIPLGATLTTLAKIQADNKNAENEVVKRILGEAEQAQVNLDMFVAAAVAPTSYVLVGQPYTADVFLTAYDSKSSPNITVNGSSIPVTAGKGKYTGDTRTEGLHTWSAEISYKDNDGVIQHKPTLPQTYMVARPSATISPTKMNVLYIGLPNPISVSSPGVAKPDLRVSMTGGSISGKDGDYTATVTAVGKATINVSGELEKNKTSVLGSMEFRVKRIPDPVAEFAGTSGGTQNTATIQGQNYIFATLKDFEFDTKFTIKSYKLTIIRPRLDAVTVNGYGNVLSADVKDKLKYVSPGTRLIFDDIYAVGPDKIDRLLNSITIKAN